MSQNSNTSYETKLLEALFGSTISENSELKSKSMKENYTYPKDWTILCSLSEHSQLVNALYQHFLPFADTNICKGLLKDILQNVDSVSVENGRFVVCLQTPLGDIAKWICSAPPEKLSDELPNSYAKLLRIHGGYSFPDFGNLAFQFNQGITAPVFLNGPDVCTMFEPESKFEEQLLVAIDTHQDWIAFSTDPSVGRRTETLFWVSHADATVRELNKDISVGGYFLRLIGRTVLGENDFRFADLLL